MPFSKKSNELLARVNFPPYTVHCLTERHILVAGGGGGAKTGVPNVIEIYELTNSGSGCRAKSVIHYETGNQAIMNCSVYNCSKYFILFAGMSGICQLYKLKLGLCLQENDRIIPNGFIKEALPSSNATLRSRKMNKEDDQPNGKIHLLSEQNGHLSEELEESTHVDLVFDIKPLDSFQTDFSKDPFQKLARFSYPLKVLATAGDDGHIRIWKYPEMRKLYEVNAHSDEVDDLDFSPLGDKIVSVSRDGYGKVWNTDDLSLECELHYDLPQKAQGAKYICRSCRFAAVEGDKANPVLFVTLNPALRKERPSPSFLCKFDSAFTLQKMISTGKEMTSVMAVSDDGRFVGLGTEKGSVAIYIAFSLQLLQRSERAHSFFVTGVEFLQSCDTTRRITGDHEASLISISVDNHINIHYIPNRATIGIFTLVIMFIVTLFFVFLLMDYYNF